MGAFASLLFLAFIIITFVFGVLLLIAGILLLIVFRVKKTPKKKKISIILLTISLILIFPFAYISISNTFHKIKYEYAIRDTGVIIEIDDYNTKEFDFDGNKYVRLNDYLNNVKELSVITNVDKKAIANVHIIEKNITQNQNLISMVTSFFFPKENDIYKLYSLGDNRDKDLLYSEFGGVWCSTEYLNQAIIYYDNIDNYHCFYVNTADFSKTKVNIDDEIYNRILSVIEKSYTTDKEKIYSLENTCFINIYAQSQNELLQFEFVHDLLVKDGEVFYITDRIVYDNDEVYYMGLKLPIRYE